MKAAKGMMRLKDQIAADTRDKAPPVPAPVTTAALRAKGARDGKQMVAGYFSQATARKFAATAALRGTTVQAMLGEAIDLLMLSYGEPPFGER